MAQDEEKQEDRKAKKKVAKTLLFNTENIAAQVEAAAQAQSQAEQVEKEVLETEVDEKEKEKHAEAPKKKRVAKTLIFDPSSAVEKAAAQEAAMAAQAEIELEIEEAQKAKELEEKRQKDQETLAAVQDVVMAAALAQEQEKVDKERALQAEKGRQDEAPELNIDGPEVKLFFEKEDAEEAPAVEQMPPPAALKVEPKPKRKVPRTMLFTPVPDLVNASLDETIAPGVAHPATQISDQPVRRISTKRIAKTLVFDNESFEPSESLDAQVAAIPMPGNTLSTVESPAAPLQSENALTPPPAPVKKIRAQQYVAKTMLDHSILFDQVSKVQHKAEEKAIEVAREKAHEPFKPFFQVEAKKKALPCSWTWDTTYATERYKYCGNCQHAVYNLQGLEKADADELVYKAENLKKYTLFERTDGLFMTSNCPVAVKRRSDTVLISVGAVVAVACLLFFMANLPKPKPQPVQATEDSGPVRFVRTATKDAKGRTIYTTTAVKDSPHGTSASANRLQPAGVKLQPGASHWDEATQKFVVDVPLEKPVAPPVASTATQSDPDTDWEFSSPQK